MPNRGRQQGTPEGKDDGPTHASIGMVYPFSVFVIAVVRLMLGGGVI